MPKFKALEKGFDGVRIIEKGEVFEHNGPSYGNWMQELDAAGNPVVKSSKDSESKADSKSKGKSKESEPKDSEEKLESKAKGKNKDSDSKEPESEPEVKGK